METAAAGVDQERSTARTKAAEAGEAINDPELYSRMSAPFATREEANDAFTAFLLDVRALREKHRIAEVVTVVCARAEGDGPVITYGQNGDASMTSLMLSFALGASEASDRMRLDAMRQRGQRAGQ